MKILFLILFLLFASFSHAATLTFQDTSGIEVGFIVQIIKADGSIRFETFPSNPTNGTTVINLPNDGTGDCFIVASFGPGGVSAAWTSRVCLTSNVPMPSSPNNASIK